jgi:hypothetical protein
VPHPQGTPTTSNCGSRLPDEPGPSPDRLAFQIARTTISLNYPGEEFETLDREVLVIFADVPPHDGETDEQCMERENANANRAARQQQELAAAAPATGQYAGNAAQGDGNIGMQALANHQQHEPRRNRLRTKDLLRDFEQDGHEVYNSLQANLGAAVAALGQLRDTLVVRRLQSNLRVATAQVKERGPGYSRSVTSSYSRSRLEHPRKRRHSNGPVEPVAEEGRGENEVM